MKRIAALAAVVIGLLAIPTAAFASTTGSGGSGYGPTGWGGSGYSTTSWGGSGYGTAGSFQPQTCYYGFQRSHHHSRRYFEWWGHGRENRGFACPYPRQFPLPGGQQQQPQSCFSQTLSFSMAAGGSEMIEVSGPQLSATEEFVYDNNTYTIMSVNADQFTAFVNNALFVNSGGPITDASGAIVCSSN